MNLPDKRRLQLSHEGLERLKEAIVEKLGRDNYTFEELSELTEETGVRRLDPDTVSKILQLKGAVYRSSLESLFRAVGLELRQSDYTYARRDSPPKLEPHQDWDDAPDVNVSTFYGRTEELATLEQWIVSDRCRLVAITGMAGIGKSSLVRRLADEIKDEFEYLIWRSLKDAPPVMEILADLIQFLSNQQQTEADLPKKVRDRISLLIKYLREYRCLLVLDDVESIWQEGERAGRYRKECEGYSELLRRVGMGEQQHPSCLVLIGREKPTEIESLVGEMPLARPLILKGLQEEAAKEILKANNLHESNRWGELIELYQGNPLALKIVSGDIRDFYEGRVSEVLGLNTTFLDDELRELLEQQFQRLSDLEKEITYWLVCEWKPVSLEQLEKQISGARSNLPSAIKSLKRRSLVETNQSLFLLQKLMMSHVKKKLIEQIYLETRDLMRNPSSDKVYFLVKFNFTINQNSRIITEVKDWLIKNSRNVTNIYEKTKKLLLSSNEECGIEEGYAKQNLENLLSEIESDLNNS